MTSGTPGQENVTSTPGTKPITPGETKTPREGVRPFAPYMQEGGGETNPLMTAGKTPQVSPFDLAHGKVPPPGPNFSTIQDQAKQAQSTLGDIHDQLNTPKLKLKQSTKYLLKNKLNSANGHIQSAAGKLGAAPAQEEEAPSGAGPLGKFLGLVTSGQRQMAQTQQQLTDLSEKGTEMRPADFLLIQIKLSKAQQELEYSSMLLGKAVDDMKQMMNIQL
jgi:uncharacterized phage infection (PIP) family protein YhgE